MERKPTDVEIAHRAYELFLARGCQHGLALQDWLDAERELTRTPRTPKNRATGTPRKG